MSTQLEPIIIVSQPNGPAAEAYRSLRVALSKQLAQGKNCFAFVSAWPGDGKSMVCTNVAVALGQFHQKVLLVDGDLRRPTISRVFGAHTLTGITNDLEGSSSTVNLGYPTKFANVSMLPRGTSEQNPANLLSPERLARVFAEYRNNYDCIIVDTPPLSACSDALTLGAQADGAALVVSPKGWDGEVELRYKQQLGEHGIDVLGVVLNGAKGGESHGYGYGYGRGYGSYGSAYGTQGYGAYGATGETKKPRARGPLAWLWSRPDKEDDHD